MILTNQKTEQKSASKESKFYPMAVVISWATRALNLLDSKLINTVVDLLLTPPGEKGQRREKSIPKEELAGVHKFTETILDIRNIIQTLIFKLSDLLESWKEIERLKKL